MPIRRANAEWKGDLKSGKGSLNTETKLLNNTPYDAGSRFESGTTTNPEEMTWCSSLRMLFNGSCKLFIERRVQSKLN